MNLKQRLIEATNAANTALEQEKHEIDKEKFIEMMEKAAAKGYDFIEVETSVKSLREYFVSQGISVSMCRINTPGNFDTYTDGWKLTWDE